MNFFKRNKFTLDDVKQHNSSTDCWVIINDKVYDVTKFLKEHPGGEEILLENAGTDATSEFDKAEHSLDAKNMMKNYEIGVLKKESNCCSISTAQHVMIATGIIILGLILIKLIR